MKLTNELQQILNHLSVNPQSPPFRSRELPMSIIRDIQRHIVKVIQDHPEKIGASVIARFGKPHRVPHELREFYATLLELGVEEDETIKRFLFWYLDAQILKIPGHLMTGGVSELTLSERTILDLVFENQRFYARSESYELVYALENHLCYYTDNQWRLTGLGRAFLRLSILQATRFLLALEIFLHAGEWDEWHMSRDFLASLMRGNKGFFQIQHRYQEGMEFPVVWSEYAERLIEFGLASQTYNQPEAVRVTETGKLTINSVLARDSAFDALIPLYIHREMTAVELLDFASQEDVERIHRLLDRSPLVGNLRESILEEVERLGQADPPYLSIFKAIAPCIEGVLRNLLTQREVTMKGSGLRGYVRALEAMSPPILRSGTLQMIDAVFRPYRNIVEHGHVIASEPARMLCEISLSVIEQIHQDYVDFESG